MAIDAGFNAISSAESRSTFHGLGVGVLAGRIGANRPFSVYNAKFTNCYFGIYNLMVSGSSILFNDFEMGTVQDVIGDEDQVGITLYGQMIELTLQLNNFIVRDSNVENTLGIVAEDIGKMSHEIRQNQFDTLTIGNEAFGINGEENLNFAPNGLIYLCNINRQGILNDFYVPDTSIYDVNLVARRQGAHHAVPFSTGNVFSVTGDTDDGDFGNYGIELDYFYYNTSLQIPIDYIGIDPIQSELNSCDTVFCLQPCIMNEELDSLKGVISQDAESFKAAMNEEELDLAAYYKSRIDSNLYHILRYYEYDTLDFDIDSLRQWYLHSHSIAGDLLTAGSHFSESDFTEAQDRLDSIPIKYNLTAQQSLEIDRIKNIYTILSGKTVFDLNATDIDSLRLYSDETGMSSAMARSVLVFADTVYMPRYYIPGEVNPRSTNSKRTKEPKQNGILVYPNPYEDMINVYIPDQSPGSVTMDIMDIYGRILHTYSLEQGVNSLVAQTLNNMTGLVFYRIQSRDVLLQTGKLTHISDR